MEGESSRRNHGSAISYAQLLACRPQAWIKRLPDVKPTNGFSRIKVNAPNSAATVREPDRECSISLSRHYFGDELKADCFLWITASNRLDIWLNAPPKGKPRVKQFRRLEDYCRVR